MNGFWITSTCVGAYVLHKAIRKVLQLGFWCFQRVIAMDKRIVNQYVLNYENKLEIAKAFVAYKHSEKYFKLLYWVAMGMVTFAWYLGMPLQVSVSLMTVITAVIISLMMYWDKLSQSYIKNNKNSENVKVIIYNKIMVLMQDNVTTVDYDDVEALISSRHFWIILTYDGTIIPISKQLFKSKEEKRDIYMLLMKKIKIL